MLLEFGALREKLFLNNYSISADDSVRHNFGTFRDQITI
jgi:hypothetical protein